MTKSKEAALDYINEIGIIGGDHGEEGYEERFQIVHDVIIEALSQPDNSQSRFDYAVSRFSQKEIIYDNAALELAEKALTWTTTLIKFGRVKPEVCVSRGEAVNSALDIYKMVVEALEAIRKAPQPDQAQRENFAQGNNFGDFDTTVITSRKPVDDAERKAALEWTEIPPTEQGWYWHTWGDEDANVYPVSVIYSGTSGKCFVSQGQLGILRAVDCDQYGGYWMKIDFPVFDQTETRKE